MLLSYVLDTSPQSKHGMDALSERHLAHKPITFKEVTTIGRKRLKNFAYVAIDKATQYAAEDADVTMRLWQVLKPRLAIAGLKHVYETLELPMIKVLARMEERGIVVDSPTLASLSVEFSARIALLGKEVDELTGKPLNPNSPKQLAKVLFVDTGLPVIKTTGKGNISTDAEVLDKLAAKGHTLPAKVIEWRALSKLKSTYTDALQKAALQGRVHTSFNLAGPVTGRLSSSDPNLQNIPIKSEDGQRVRRAFIVPEGHKIVVAEFTD
jgi:DNA polymerase-1